MLCNSYSFFKKKYTTLNWDRLIIYGEHVRTVILSVTFKWMKFTFFLFQVYFRTNTLNEILLNIENRNDFISQSRIRLTIKNFSFVQVFKKWFVIFFTTYKIKKRKNNKFLYVKHDNLRIFFIKIHSNTSCHNIINVTSTK